ncbi:serine hydrolase domain-containing protein [Xanthomarina sp. F2636L]|uniref:serine hydrolase domain-containing protein n=1 Tax=Xanthomarina sp. F2636L TaxID=2996018 RepID=UPI00225E1C8D|nr:serine hydrolase [Xanthomarina sp. F2636L]MCX7549725.1 serine hydrolase [Xanthomarina sp. F2636L]
MKNIYLLAFIATFSFHVKAQNNPFKPIQNNDGWQTSYLLENNLKLQIMDSLIAYGKFKQMSSVVIAHQGKVVFENYYNSNTPNTKHNTRSATKTITGTLIGCLLQDGSLKSVTEKATIYSKTKGVQYSDSRKDKITIEDLLTMSSILECDDWDQNSRGQEEKMYLIEDWVQFYWDLPIKGFPEWKTKPKDTKYGRSFSYCTAGVVVLGDIINTISGNLENYADQALFSKLGITDYHWQKTPTGQPMTGGGLGLKSRDLLKIGQLYINKGKWENNQIISENFVSESTRPHSEVGMFDYEYGYLWWLSEFGKKDEKVKASFMTGTGGNKVVIFPDLELVVVLTSTYFNGGMESHQQTANLLNDFIVPEIIKLD